MLSAGRWFPRPRFTCRYTWKPAKNKAVMSQAAGRSAEQGCYGRDCGMKTSLVRGTVMLGWLSLGKCAFFDGLIKGCLVGFYLNNFYYWLIASGCQGQREHDGISSTSRLVAITSKHVLHGATCSCGSHLCLPCDLAGFTILPRRHHLNWVFPCWWPALSLSLVTGLWCFSCFRELN